MGAAIIVLVLNVSILVAAHADYGTNEYRELMFSKHYEPYEPNIEPKAPGYKLPLDINDIVNFHDVGQVINLNAVSNLIQQNGFAILEPGIYSDISYYDFDSLYWSLGRYKIPAFVTIDTGLYLYHTLLDEALKGIENPILRTRICDLKNQPFTVGKYGSGAYVRGLDLMALLGSNEAFKILDDEVNAGFGRDESKSSISKDEVDASSHVNWHKNLYWSWLYSMQSLLQKLPKGYPEFMRTQAWRRHQLHAGLASWIQLHDDTIRQPDPTEPRYPIPIAATRPPIPPPPLPLGYVEPTPMFWGRLLSLTRMTSKGLDEIGVLRPESRVRFSHLEELLHRTHEIADRQLSNEPPSSEERDFFGKLPSILGRMLPGVQENSLATILTSDIRKSETDAMGIEQAVGDIDLIIVACPTFDGKARLAIGPVLSYYEFERIQRNNLTDETWRLILDSPAKPDRPGWYSPLISLREDFFGLTRLTNNLLPDGTARWSPDGKRIVFAGSEKEWTSDIYIMNADGTEKKKLTNNPGIHSSPSWSPEGKKIAFQFYVRDKGEIYVMNADGSDQKRMTNNNAHDGGPCWSPDGKRIVFWSKRLGQSEIYVMNADGSEQNRLTYNPANDLYPCWSSDGKKIAFESDRDGKHINYEVYVMNIDSSEEKRLTNNPNYDGSPCWSPDGKEIAFVSRRDGNSEIYVMNVDGSKQRRLTYNSVDDGRPCWSPDGRQIVFESFIGGGPEICIMNLEQRNK